MIIHEVLRQFIQHPSLYPIDFERLLLGLYLVDWKACIELGRQFSNLVWGCYWTPNRCKPVADLTPIFEGLKFELASVDGKVNICSVEGISPYQPTEEEQRAIDHVITTLKKYNLDQLYSIVMSTFPMLLRQYGKAASIRTMENLVEEARLYRKWPKNRIGELDKLIKSSNLSWEDLRKIMENQSFTDNEKIERGIVEGKEDERGT